MEWTNFMFSFSPLNTHTHTLHNLSLPPPSHYILKQSNSTPATSHTAHTNSQIPKYPPFPLSHENVS